MKYLLILSAIFFASCAGKPVQNQIPQPKITKHQIDLTKIKTVDDVRALLVWMLPENPAALVREDSLQDSKKLDGIKHLLKEEDKK